MIDNTIDLLTAFTALLGVLLAVGYSSNVIGRKLYVSCKNNVNCDAMANKRAFITGLLIIAIYIVTIIALQIYLQFDKALIVTVTGSCTASTLAGFIHNTDFKDAED